jgi:hypothetical protein
MSTRIRRVYLHPRMVYTIFQSPKTRALLEAGGLSFVETPAAADVLVGSRTSMIAEFVRQAGNSGKAFVLWTHEPRFWTDQRREAVICGARIRVFSLYSGEIYRNNYYYVDINCGGFEAQEIDHLPGRRTVCIAQHQADARDLIIGGTQVDLYQLRSRIALCGRERGVLDIYGAGWPDGVSLGVSRQGKYVLEKYRLFQSYAFNLCFENTCWPYYCSEKIWQSIQGGRLPIYFGQPSIYEDFPPDSFVDYARFDSPAALFEFLAALPEAEYVRRYNQCLQVFKRARGRGQASRLDVARYTAEVISRL